MISADVIVNLSFPKNKPRSVSLFQFTILQAHSLYSKMCSSVVVLLLAVAFPLEIIKAGKVSEFQICRVKITLTSCRLVNILKRGDGF